MTALDALVFAWRRFWALRAFHARQRRRRKARFPTVWRSHLQLVSEDVALLHDADPAQANETLLQRLIDGRTETQKTLLSRSAISTAITVFLLLTTFNIDLPVSVAGIQFKSTKYVYELLLVVNAAISCSGAARIMSIATMTVAIKGLIAAIIPPESRYFHHLALHGNEPPVLFPHPLSPHLIWTKPTSIAATLSLLLLIGLVLALLLAAIGTRVIFYQHILATPSGEPWVASAAVITAAALDLLTLTYLAVFVLPLPFTDYGLLTTFDIARQTNSDTLSRLNEQHFADEVEDEARMREAGYLRD